ncbi:hypothetical protein V5799_003198 [Amblyomma americanum]|uniref:Uncharacterized protein n=1 Tax=Amblyomma americanum TaxID=6943 RepID=A0AAQ4D9M9_AMBAM
MSHIYFIEMAWIKSSYAILFNSYSLQAAQQKTAILCSLGLFVTKAFLHTCYGMQLKIKSSQAAWMGAY